MIATIRPLVLGGFHDSVSTDVSIAAPWKLIWCLCVWEACATPCAASSLLWGKWVLCPRPCAGATTHTPTRSFVSAWFKSMSWLWRALCWNVPQVHTWLMLKMAVVWKYIGGLSKVYCLVYNIHRVYYIGLFPTGSFPVGNPGSHQHFQVGSLVTLALMSQKGRSFVSCRSMQCTSL